MPLLRSITTNQSSRTGSSHHAQEPSTPKSQAGHEPSNHTARQYSAYTCATHRHHDRQINATPLNVVAFSRRQPDPIKIRLPVSVATADAPRDAPEPDSP